MDWDTVTAWGSEVLSDWKLTVLPEVTSQNYSMTYLLLLKFYCFRALGKIALNNRGFSGVLCDGLKPLIRSVPVSSVTSQKLF